MKKCDAVFEGGGVKGIAFVGAIQEAERRGYSFQNVAGTSAGAIIAALLVAGYTGDELEELLDEMPFQTLNPTGWGKVPFIGKGLNVLIKNGIYSGMEIETWMQDKLKKKGIYRFGDLAPNRLSIIASDITNGRIMQIPQDLEAYKLNPQSFSIARAVRMSSTIPYFFQPVIIRQGKQKIVIVDGGLLSNFPVWIFDSKESPQWPTFGFRLRGSDCYDPAKITGPFSMYVAILSTMREAHDRRYVNPEDAVRTMFIPADDIRATDFSMTANEKEKLIALGQQEAQKFFDHWNFPHYVQQYRQSSTAIKIK